MNSLVPSGIVFRMGWKSKLELWPYAAIVIAVIGLLYVIVLSTR
jgi:hypothetical protein